MILTSGLMTLFSMSALASGGTLSGSSIGSSTYQRQVDQTYETGKAIYQGRLAGSPKLSYCVAAGDEVVGLKTKTLREYKKTTYEHFAQNLYNCDKPDTLAAAELTKDDLIYVLYYLNKRYKLSLVGNS